MSGTLFILWLTVILCLVKTTAFFTLAAFDRKNIPARWLGLAFLAAALSHAGELVLATGVAPFASGLVIATAMGAALILIAHGLSARYGTVLPGWVGLAILAVLAVFYAVVITLPRGEFFRNVFYQLPYFALSLWIAAIIFRAPRKDFADRIFLAVFALMAIQFAAKPFVAMAIGGVGETAEQFATTTYAAFSIASGAVLLLGMATLVLGIMIHDSARVLIGRAERDSETALYNRDGFATHANRQLLALNRKAVPVTLVIIALDNPATHDAAPVRFLAKLLGKMVPKEALIGRMADGELAVLCPGHSLFEARDGAETLRQRAAIPLSIGIAESEPGDVYPQILARGLWALDEAQKAGGDCVRLAVRSDFGLSAPVRL